MGVRVVQHGSRLDSLRPACATLSYPQRILRIAQTLTKMEDPDLYEQLEQEQHTTSSLRARLCKAYKQLDRLEQQLGSAKCTIRAYEEHLSVDKQMRVITELWQQLHDALAAAQQKQSAQQLQAMQANSVLVEMREQLKVDKAGQAAAFRQYEEVLQCQAAAAQHTLNIKLGLESEVNTLKQRLAAAASHQHELQQELQKAQEQSNAAARLSADNITLKASIAGRQCSSSLQAPLPPETLRASNSQQHSSRPRRGLLSVTRHTA